MYSPLPFVLTSPFLPHFFRVPHSPMDDVSSRCFSCSLSASLEELTATKAALSQKSAEVAALTSEIENLERKRTALISQHEAYHSPSPSPLSLLLTLSLSQ